MKKTLFIVLLLTFVVGLVWRWLAPAENVAHENGPVIAWEGRAPDSVVLDPVEIFKRAFWRMPSAGDRILKAERHEWSDSEGVTKWQWFLAVEASPELIKYLRDDNAFGLISADLPEVPTEKPAWFQFPAEDFSVMRSSRSEMQLIFSKKGSKLYACASGRGFTRGAPEPEPETARQVPAGRLPKTPPPSQPR